MSRSLLWAVAASGFVVVALIGFLVMRPGAKDAAPAVRSVAETKPSPVTALASVPMPDGKSIAVLPFSNMSDDKDANAFFADGIHEDVLTNLANIAELKVISRTSVMQYRDTKVPLRKIAQDLGVAYVLEGSVRRAGAQVRVTGQLIRAATDEHVWAQNYDRELKDIFAIQTALATEIAGALRSVLSPQEKTLIARVPTASLDAYDLYLNARAVRNRLGSSLESLQEQEQLLERAVAIDPRFGLAWAKLAWARCHLSSRTVGGKATGLNPDSKDVWLGQSYRINVAHVHAWTGDTAGALREYERLLQTMEKRDGLGGCVINVHAMRRHPAFAPLRNDPRFKALLDDPKNNAPLF